ncbi:MAG: response regulator [Planctomycetota bacterium]
MKQNASLVQFLLVEDEDSHAELVRLAFERNSVANSLVRVSSGHDALAYLNREGKYADQPMPDVVLLDLNLPGISGHEVLERIRQNPGLAKLPVVVLTTSSNDNDRSRAYDLGANSYLTKPLEFESFQQMVRDLQLYWGVWNRPPIAAESTASSAVVSNA